MRSSLAFVLILSAATACSPGYTASTSTSDDGGSGTVAVIPDASTLLTGASQQFTTQVTGGVNGVAWTIQESPSGGSVSDAGFYTAPATAGAFHVVATSLAAPLVNGSATVTVASIAVTPSPATADSCSTVSFSATVSGLTNTSVNWTVQEGSTGGTITPGGVYTAPATPGTYHVVATSQASSNITATAAVTVSNHILSVVVSPSTITLPVGATTQFSVTVTSSCGAVTSVKTYTAGGANR